MPPEAIPVAVLARALKERLEQDPALQDLWIAGEISNLTIAQSGHAYFNLKDESASIRCVFWRSANMGQRQHLEHGASLIVHGAIGFYEARGELQFVVDFVQPAGVGALQAEFERRKAGYEEEGLFDLSRKRPLPVFPRTVGVVTSERGAALQDILTVLGRRWPLSRVVVAHTLVQGEGAAESIAQAIREVAPHGAPEAWPDVLIVGRGGGSAEDLWAFNEDPVVRAIFGCPVPVVSAVGHETDVTLADLVADVRAPTPSAAAEVVVPDRGEVARRVQSMHATNLMRVTRHIAAGHQAVERAITRMERVLPDTRPMHRRVAQHADSMRHAAHRAVAEAREHTSSVAARLRTLSPVATLERGYALVSHEDGRPISSAAAVEAGDTTVIRWRDGSHRARVESDA